MINQSMEVSVLNKHGTLVQRDTNKQEHIVLMNPEGMQFQVSHTAHMVWNMLDGDTQLNQIAKKIGAIAEIEPDRMQDVVEEIVKGLKDVDLVG